MSSAPASPTPAPAPPPKSVPDIIRIYSHSSLYYWWPVWVFGYLLFFISLYDNTRILHVPSDTQVSRISEAKRYELTSPKHDEDLARRLNKYETPKTEEEKADKQRPPRLSHRAWMGASYCILLLIVILITNVPLRGLWSVIVIITIVLLAVIFGLAGWWDDIFYAIGGLHIHIGMAGYFFVSTALFIMWLIVTMVFDRQIYITFVPGQMKVCEEVGGAEKAYDTVGMSIEKHRDDLFRHWVLGLGSGDLTVRTSGATPHQVVLPNVLNISGKLRMIEEMQRERQFVPGQ